ncbi:MAG: hypothetical protein R2710_29855 [Acidimicrobiales bacterium]
MRREGLGDDAVGVGEHGVDVAEGVGVVEQHIALGPRHSGRRAELSACTMDEIASSGSYSTSISSAASSPTPRLGDDHGHRITDMADPVDGERSEQGVVELVER